MVVIHCIALMESQMLYILQFPQFINIIIIILIVSCHNHIETCIMLSYGLYGLSYSSRQC